MDLGNQYIGCTFSENYTCIFIFPFGIEVMYFADFQISFTFALVNFTIGFGKNRTLFND